MSLKLVSEKVSNGWYMPVALLFLDLRKNILKDCNLMIPLSNLPHIMVSISKQMRGQQVYIGGVMEYQV